MGKERYFGSKIVLMVRAFHLQTRTLDVVKRILDLIDYQGWGDLFLDTSLMIYELEVVEFYVNLNVIEDIVSTLYVKGVELVFDHLRLGEIFYIPTSGLAKYVWAKDENFLLTSKYSQVPAAPPHATSPVACLVNDLHVAKAQNIVLQSELETLHIDLVVSHGEFARLKD
ncbi:hypothetical protein H5410_036523 [Solanum commersonii]|uniref:Uncharacterized protein n=1 Tax=Solanum commersonii TaxID=4109 RepID=A0A9J5Y3R9_SOLCO|nr:hypothetical protein H5410_036523 [Solanum commersonii]